MSADEARARAYVDLRRYADAEPLLIRALAHDPDNPRLWELLAECRYRQDQAASALEAARHAITLAPEDELPHRLASAALVDLGRRPEAAAAAREAVRLDPDHWPTHAQLALALRHVRGRQARTDAREAAARAVALAPEDAGTHFVMGVVAQGRYDLDLAELAYRKALELDPQHAESMNNLGNVMLALGRYGEAGVDFTSSLRADPRLDLVRHNIDCMGWFLLRSGYFAALGGFVALGCARAAASATGYGIRMGVGVVLLYAWTRLVRRAVRLRPTEVRAYLLRLPRVRPQFAVVTVVVALCVLGTLFAAFAPPSLAGTSLLVAGSAILTATLAFLTLKV